MAGGLEIAWCVSEYAVRFPIRFGSRVRFLVGGTYWLVDERLQLGWVVVVGWGEFRVTVIVFFAGGDRCRSVVIDFVGEYGCERLPLAFLTGGIVGLVVPRRRSWMSRRMGRGVVLVGWCRSVLVVWAVGWDLHWPCRSGGLLFPGRRCRSPLLVVVDLVLWRWCFRLRDDG